MRTPTISILPSNFRQAVNTLQEKPAQEREVFLAGPVESFAISEFESVQASVKSWDNLPGLDADDRKDFVDVNVRERRFQGGMVGDRDEGTSTSMSVKPNEITAMHVEFSPESVEIFRLKQNDGQLVGSHMHCDRVTGEAYIVRI